MIPLNPLLPFSTAYDQHIVDEDVLGHLERHLHQDNMSRYKDNFGDMHLSEYSPECIAGIPYSSHPKDAEFFKICFTYKQKVYEVLLYRFSDFKCPTAFHLRVFTPGFNSSLSYPIVDVINCTNPSGFYPFLNPTLVPADRPSINASTHDIIFGPISKVLSKGIIDIPPELEKVAWWRTSGDTESEIEKTGEYINVYLDEIGFQKSPEYHLGLAHLALVPDIPGIFHNVHQLSYNEQYQFYESKDMSKGLLREKCIETDMELYIQGINQTEDLIHGYPYIGRTCSLLSEVPFTDFRFTYKLVGGVQSWNTTIHVEIEYAINRYIALQPSLQLETSNWMHMARSIGDTLLLEIEFLIQDQLTKSTSPNAAEIIITKQFNEDVIVIIRDDTFEDDLVFYVNLAYVYFHGPTLAFERL